MNKEQLLGLAVNVSMGVIVLGLGLQATIASIAYLLQRPALLARSIVSMNVIMVVFATLAALLLDLNPAIKIAIVALALSPVPPVLPFQQRRAYGTPSYAVGLLLIAAALSVVVVPLGMLLIDAVFGLNNVVPAGSIASVILITVVAPLILGMLVRQFWPLLADRLVKPFMILGVVLLLAALVPLIAAAWPLIVSMVGNGTLLALVAFSVVGVAIGHWLGGPEPDDRSVLALATATRHPGVALAIAGATYPIETAVLAVVLWHLIAAAVVCTPYVVWQQRQHADGAPHSRGAAAGGARK